MTFLSRIFESSNRFTAPLRPNFPFVAVGDIHGNLGALDAMLSAIASYDDLPSRLMFVGDYIDRGSDSAAVFNTLYDLHQRRGCVCLLGNHEHMMLEFLRSPVDAGQRWLRYGGLQTLASFDIPISSASPNPEEAALVAKMLRTALGSELLSWISGMPLTWQSGNILVTHAGLDPMTPVEHQMRDTHLFGHPQFRKRCRTDGIWVVHGHSVVDEPTIKDGVISIDTGAYATNRLSAAIITEKHIEFLCV